MKQGRATPAFDQRRDADLVVLRLPSPISVNAIWSPRGGGGIRLSDPYRAWLKEAGIRLSAQRPGRIAGRYELTIRLPAESNIDPDNGIKVLSDLLEKNGVIRNDRDADAVHIYRQSETEDAIVEVRPFVAPDMNGRAR